MENNHKLALYVAYYLAKFDQLALENLGYTNWTSAFQDVAEKLDCKIHSVRNWRDEFDPLFEFRAGWHQRPMSPSREQVALALENLLEPQIRNIVISILSGKIKDETDEMDKLLLIATENPSSNKRGFILRGPTGKAAELFFQDHFTKTGQPVNGTLVDTREHGCGYDYRIDAAEQSFYVEVKGLAEATGGVSFTDKEWATARENGEQYYLCLISNLSDNPVVEFFNNPSKKFDPKMSIYTSIQTSWGISHNQLKAVND